MCNLKSLAWMFTIFILSTLTILSQTDDCPAILQTALDAVDQLCDPTSRNQACYGNATLTATSNDKSTDFIFEKPGNIVDVITLDSLQLEPFDLMTGDWGIVYFSLQANLPDTQPGQNVIFLAFGDVDVWDIDEGMQTFRFQSGIGTAGCEEITDGILIQTPQGVGTIDFAINGVQIELGSILFITAQPEGEMRFSLLEGNADITADGKTQLLQEGETLVIPIDENLDPIQGPNAPEPLEDDFANLLPVLNLVDFEFSSEIIDSASSEVVPRNGVWNATITYGEGCFNLAGQTRGVAVGYNFEPLDNGNILMTEYSGDSFELIISDEGIYTYEDEQQSESFTILSETEIYIETTLLGDFEGCSRVTSFTFQSE